MNFVDLQPQSFLDYAWTSPTPVAGANVPKPARTSRKQNRCCDQCRKGKRACDAAILEDALLNTNDSNGENPNTFHYSDVFGPLARCGNCEKTKKTCTFEWLRSQRMLQAMTPQPSSIPPTKKRRTNSNPSQGRKDNTAQLRGQQVPQYTSASDSGSGQAWTTQTEPVDVGLTFADFPCGIPAFDDTLMQLPYDHAPTELWGNSIPVTEGVIPGDNSEKQRDPALFEWDSGHGSSIDTASSVDADRGFEESSPSVGSPDESKSACRAVHVSHKRRRRGSPAASTTPDWSVALTNDLLSSANSAFLADGLLRVYHESFETSLSCWLTERTCPYGKGYDVSLPNNSAPDWNRIYHRVFKLDQSPSVRGRLLSRSEDRAVSRALNLAIFSFASQWAVPDSKPRARYPFHVDENNEILRQPGEATSNYYKFDRSLQLTAWHQARKAINEASNIESFRLVLAHIVFSLTQKPDYHEETEQKPVCEQPVPSKAIEDEEEATKECEDLLSKLDLTMKEDGPPHHLEQGLRLVHSLRSRMSMSGAFGGRRKKRPRCWKHLQPSGLEAADGATVDLLFSLAITFDTLSSAMHKRPLVVSLEDSDLPAITSIMRKDEPSPQAAIRTDPKAEDCWDDQLFRRQQHQKQRVPVRWPCPVDEAASLLCEAAPIKILLFRKVTRIQTLLARYAPSDKIEAAVHGALEVYEHWQRAYAPFIRDCIESHNELPGQVQSWYVCLAGHWHLATLLLADLIETMDETGSGLESRRRQRDSLNFIARFREENCRSLSDIARCACSQEDSALSQANYGHFVIDQGGLGSEPWADVLVRAFATAGAVLLEAAAVPTGSSFGQNDAFKRAADCIRALQSLGQRSDKALAAANLLAEELKLRRERMCQVFPIAGSHAVACAG